jgi:hypothetical protein
VTLPTCENRSYLRTKQSKLGHLLEIEDLNASSEKKSGAVAV